MSIDTTDKIYFAYTPYVHPEGAWDWELINDKPRLVRKSRARATIALRIIKGEVHYGIAICSEEDNFNKAEGRALAETRLKAGFGKFPIEEGVYSRFSDMHDLSLYFLRNIVNSLEKDIRKAQQKVHKKKKPREQLRIAHNTSPIKNSVT